MPATAGRPIAPISTAPAVERQILLRPDVETGGFAVEVLPPFDGIGHDQCHLTYKAARSYAGGLRMVLGLELVDRCDEAQR